VAQDLSRVDVHNTAELLSFFKIGEHEIRALAAGSELNTDDNAKIEFSSPWYLHANTGALNWELLDESTAGPMPYLVGVNGAAAGIDFLTALEAAYRDRGRRKEAELVEEAMGRME